MAEYKDLFQFAAQLGTGGLLAVFIFIVYNRSNQKQLDDGKGREELLMNVVTNCTAAIVKNTAVIEANIAVTNDLRRDLTAVTQMLAHERPQRRG